MRFSTRLTPTAVFALVALGVLLTAAILAIAVVRGSPVNLFFVQIGARQPPAAPVDVPKSVPVQVRLNLEFDPQVNARAPELAVRGFVKGIDGRQQTLLLRHGVDVGSMYVEAAIPDATTPIYLEIETANGIWKTDDFSLAQSRVRAFQVRRVP